MIEPVDPGAGGPDMETIDQQDLDHYGYRLLVSLTRHREEVGLNRAFLNALSIVVPKLNFRLYLRDNHFDDWKLISATGMDLEQGDRIDRETKARDVNLMESAQDVQPGKLSYRQEGTLFLCLFPIMLGNDYFAAVVSDGFYQASGNELLESLLDAYSNLYTLLYRSNHDPLTGLLNRQSFDLAFGRVSEGIAAEHKAFLVIIDIDHFKKINDTHGHLAGDDALAHLARLMFESFRDGDLLFRFGGEEFVVLLNAVEGESAQGILDRFREKVATSQFPKIGRVTISLGYTALRSGDKQLKLISRADQALYHAKENGRNQCRSYESLEAPASGN